MQWRSLTFTTPCVRGNSFDPAREHAFFCHRYYSGFLQIKIDEEDKMTAFSTPLGHYHFHILPYGLSKHPASLKRLIGVVLRKITGTEFWVSIDDVITFSDTIEEHACQLQHVLQRFEKANLQLQAGKCVFAQPQVQYMSYVVSRGVITASRDKVKAARQYRVPKNAKDVKSFSWNSVIVQTPSSQVIVQTPSSQVIVQTPSSQVIVETPSSQVIAQTPSSQVIVQTPSSQVIVQTPSSQVIVQTPSSQVRGNSQTADN